MGRRRRRARRLRSGCGRSSRMRSTSGCSASATGRSAVSGAAPRGEPGDRGRGERCLRTRRDRGRQVGARPPDPPRPSPRLDRPVATAPRPATSAILLPEEPGPGGRRDACCVNPPTPRRDRPAWATRSTSAMSCEQVEGGPRRGVRRHRRGERASGSSPTMRLPPLERLRALQPGGHRRLAAARRLPGGAAVFGAGSPRRTG